MKTPKRPSIDPGSTPVVRVVTTAKERAWFDAQLQEAHDLGASPSVGDFLRQIVELDSQPVALLAWGSACYALKDRDRWISWSAPQRVARLKLIVQNRRLLVMVPKGSSPNLASMAMGAALRALPTQWREAFGYRSFQLLMAGYFVCGFQVVFIGVHMPSYLRDQGLAPQVASTALALIGLFNIAGTYLAGSLGQRLPKNWILSAIYTARGVFIALFLSVPVTTTSVYLFAAAMGLLWLSTVPVTNAVIAQIFGVSHLSMLSGFVFMSHQFGSYLGVWLGGWVYDRMGSYDLVWWLCIGLSVMAALINLPVREHPIERMAVGA